MVKSVAVVGGNGKVGKLILQRLKQSKEFEPLSIIRNEQQVSFFAKQDIATKVISLEDTVDNLANAFKGQHAIAFTAGAGGKGLDKTFSIDLDGAVKVMEAAARSNIKRFIMVSAINAEDRDAWYDTSLRSYYIAKKYADRELQRTDLDWTILRPGFLTGESAGEATLKFKEDAVDGEVTRDDVAAVVVESLKRDDTIHKIISFVNGDLSLDALLSK